MKDHSTWYGALVGSFAALVSIAFSYYLLVPRSIDRQFLNPLEANHLSHDRVVFRRMLARLAEKDGMVFFGTSESARLITDEANYFELVMNRANVPVVAFGGARRTPTTWMNWLCQTRDPSEIPRRIFYLVNPIYFADWLNNESSVTSTGNFISLEQARAVSACLERLKPATASDNDLTRLSALMGTSERFPPAGYLLKERVFAGAYNLAGPIERFFGFFRSPRAHSRIPPPWWMEIDERYNVFSAFRASPSFSSQDSVRVISDPDAIRFVELRVLVDLAANNGAGIVFILGPYNRTFFSQVNPDAVEEFDRAIDVAREIVCRRSSCIDLSDRSSDIGIFADYAHFSGGGAALVAAEVEKFMKNAGLNGSQAHRRRIPMASAHPPHL